jgi:hypothetical protein
MRPGVLVLAWILVAAWPPRAQAAEPPAPPPARQAPTIATPPRFELFGGYSYLSQPDPDNPSGGVEGFAVGFDINMGRPFGRTSLFGLRGDFDRHIWTVPASGGDYPMSVQDISLIFVSVGERFAVEAGRLTAVALATFDVPMSHYSGLSGTIPVFGPFTTLLSHPAPGDRALAAEPISRWRAVWRCAWFWSTTTWAATARGRAATFA